MRRWSLPNPAGLPLSRVVWVDVSLSLLGLLMFISGWTQQEIKHLYLREVEVVPPRGPCGKSRVGVVNILPSGSVVVNRERLFEPDSGGDSLLREYLRQKASRMRQRSHEPGGVRLPNHPILIRADRTVPFADVERVLQAARDVGIWRVRFGVVQKR